ncbi:NnrS family protein [Pseudomonadota bacterium]
MPQLFLNLSAKPHKLFFLGGILNAMVFMAIMLGQYAGFAYPVVAPKLYHAYSMFFAVFTQFFTAFLFTMFPRFLVADEVPKKRYVTIFLLLNISSLLYAMAVYVSQTIAALAMLGLFVAHACIFKTLWELNAQGSSPDRYDTNWMLGAFSLGVLSHLLFVLQQFGVGPVSLDIFAINMGFFLYLFLLVLTLSQKMIPFFTENKVQGYKSNKTPFFLEAMFLLLAIKVLLISLQLSSFDVVVDLLLFAMTLQELIKWRLPFFKVDAMLWVLYLSLLWIPLGFLLYVFSDLGQLFSGSGAVMFEKVHLHAIAVGYFVTIAIGFGSRIILGHAGHKPLADRFTIGLFGLVQVLVFSRIIGGLSLNLDTALYIPLIIFSALVWLVLFTLWSKRYLKLLFQ